VATEDPASAAPVDPETLSAPEDVVRPKRPVGGRVAANPPNSSLARRERASVRTTSADFADRVTVGSPRATLPRGTLVPVKLSRALAGPNPGRAEAIVTEEVAADGVVLVPKGSTVSCLARPPADGRVPLSCDRISTSDRVLAFSGVAVGEGQRVGLRLLDEEIAAGTMFVVYVSAPAALR
jgi:serine/threonine-protein kinase